MFHVVTCLLLVWQRLQAKIIKIVDVSYGGENGFNQAIELASEALANVKFIQEKKLIGTYSLFNSYILGVNYVCTLQVLFTDFYHLKSQNCVCI